jgi:hypothetical protein
VVRFDMTPEEVHAAVGPPDFRKGPGPFTGAVCEQFRSERMLVEFDREGRCCSIELYKGAPVFWSGVDLMSCSYRRWVELLNDAPGRLVENDDGLRCDELGLGCYVPGKQDPAIRDPAVEGILVYRRGYYDTVKPN